MRFLHLLPFAVVMAILALPILSSAALAAPDAKQVQISVTDYKFDPATVTVNAGDTVVWTNNGAVAHTVTASDGSWDSGNLAPGQSYSHTFDEAGTVAYYCSYHGSASGSGMAANLVVQAGSTSASPAPAATQASAVATSQPAAQPSGGTASIDVSDQPLDEGYITIPMVMAVQDGWMVVHANTADNKPGPVIGHTAVKAGTNMNVEVTLGPAPKPGDKVWPMLHIDAGKIGVYEFPGPDAPVIQNGDIVMKEITILAASSAPAGTATPKALPNTGDGDSSSPWILPLAAAVLLLLSGAILVGGNRADKQS